MKYIGVLILINVVVVLAYLAQQPSYDWKRLASFGAIGIFAGLLVFFGDRVTNVKVDGVGEISTVVAQAMADAEQVSKIKAQVEAHRDSLDLVIRDVNQARVRISDLTELTDKAGDELKTLKSVQEKGAELLKSIEELSQFSHVLMLAKNDDRKAFNELLSMHNNKTRFHEVALRAIEQIVQEVDPLLQVRLDAQVSWESLGVSIDKSSFQEFKTAYQNAHAMHRPSILSAIWEQKRFSKADKVSFLAELLVTENSLRALHRVCVLINKEANINMNILGVPNYLKWWEDNKQQFAKPSL